MEHTRSLFTPHPLLPHGNTCYNSLIILNSLPLLLLSELFWHKYRRPMEELCSQSTSWTSPQTTEETLRRRRTDTTHRPTYSMSRTIQATRRQKGFTCQCHCCLQVWSVCVEVTGHTDLPTGTYSDEASVRQMRQQECLFCSHHLSVRPAEHMVCYTSVQQRIGHLWHAYGLLQLAFVPRPPPRFWEEAWEQG